MPGQRRVGQECPVHQVLAAQDRLDGFGDGLRTGGPAEEGAGAEAEGVEDAFVLGLAGEEDDRQPGEVAAQGGGDVQPGQPRQLHVHQRQVGSMVCRRSQCFMAIGCFGDDGETRIVLQQTAKSAPVQGLVVHDQHTVLGL